MVIWSPLWQAMLGPLHCLSVTFLITVHYIWFSGINARDLLRCMVLDVFLLSPSCSTLPFNIQLICRVLCCFQIIVSEILMLLCRLPLCFVLLWFYAFSMIKWIILGSSAAMYQSFGFVLLFQIWRTGLSNTEVFQEWSIIWLWRTTNCRW